MQEQIDIANELELERVQKIIVDVAARNSFAAAVDASQIRYKGQ